MRSLGSMAGVWVAVAVTTVTVSATEIWFPPDAVVDVTQPPYTAKPDDGVDDTAAIQKAVTDNVDSGRMLFFPPGVYDISAPIAAKNVKGFWRAHLTFQGAGRERTILKLADGAKGFGDPAKPTAVYSSGSHWEKGDGLEGGGNKAFRNQFFDLTVNTGSRNPGAIGIAWAVSNQGTLKNVTVRSGDGAGVAGIAMTRRIPGPGLIKNVTVTGFDVGIDVGDIQYGVTLENVSLSGQRVAGMRTDKNLLHARKITSVNAVPAILITGIEGGLTLLDSRLTGGAAEAPAIVSDGAVRLRNVEIDGYRAAAVRVRGIDKVVTREDGCLFPQALGGGSDKKGAGSEVTGVALLPVEETPEPPAFARAEWIGVGARNPDEENDTEAIQRAFDSGRSVVYFPKGRTYFLSDTITVPASVQRVVGFGAEINLGAAEKPFSDVAKPRPLFRVSGGESAPALFFDLMFFNAQYPGQVLFENDSPRDLVIRNSMGWVGGGNGVRRSYQNTKRATGKLFLEDVFLPGWKFAGQRVWARQFNPENWESDGSEPQVLNDGGKLWILGFKTEGAAPFITTKAGGVTELLGAYNYVSATKSETLNKELVPYVIEDSVAQLGFTTENFRDDDYTVYIREVRNGGNDGNRNGNGDGDGGGDRKTIDWKGADLWPRNGRAGDRSFTVPLFSSRR